MLKTLELESGRAGFREAGCVQKPLHHVASMNQEQEAIKKEMVKEQEKILEKLFRKLGRERIRSKKFPL